jgi:hypothetical protein
MNETQATITQPLDEAKKALQDAQKLMDPTTPAQPVSTAPAPEPEPATTSPATAALEAIPASPTGESPPAAAPERPEPSTEKQA